MTVKLNYDAARRCGAIINREEYLQMYNFNKDTITVFKDAITQNMKLVVGAPLIMSVEGTYIKIDELPHLCDYGVRAIVEEWVSCAHKALIPKTYIKFGWRR